MATQKKNKVYFDWLVGILGKRGKEYSKLLRLAYDTDFKVIIGGDENRLIDGEETLRQQYLDEVGGRMVQYADEPPIEMKECSVLEMMIALAIRMNGLFVDLQSPVNPSKWFWMMIDNLELSDYNDTYFLDGEIPQMILEVFVNRTYAPDGTGGLFPMPGAHNDQRVVEIWYQMQQYMIQEW